MLVQLQLLVDLPPLLQFLFLCQIMKLHQSHQHNLLLQGECPEVCRIILITLTFLFNSLFLARSLSRIRVIKKPLSTKKTCTPACPKGTRNKYDAFSQCDIITLMTAKALNPSRLTKKSSFLCIQDKIFRFD